MMSMISTRKRGPWFQVFVRVELEWGDNRTANFLLRTPVVVFNVARGTLSDEDVSRADGSNR